MATVNEPLEVPLEKSSKPNEVEIPQNVVNNESALADKRASRSSNKSRTDERVPEESSTNDAQSNEKAAVENADDLVEIPTVKTAENVQNKAKSPRKSIADNSGVIIVAQPAERRISRRGQRVSSEYGLADITPNAKEVNVETPNTPKSTASKRKSGANAENTETNTPKTAASKVKSGANAETTETNAPKSTASKRIAGDTAENANTNTPKSTASMVKSGAIAENAETNTPKSTSSKRKSNVTAENAENISRNTASKRKSDTGNKTTQSIEKELVTTKSSASKRKADATNKTAALEESNENNGSKSPIYASKSRQSDRILVEIEKSAQNILESPKASTSKRDSEVRKSGISDKKRNATMTQSAEKVRKNRRRFSSENELADIFEDSVNKSKNSMILKLLDNDKSNSLAHKSTGNQDNDDDSDSDESIENIQKFIESYERKSNKSDNQSFDDIAADGYENVDFSEKDYGTQDNEVSFRRLSQELMPPPKIAKPQKIVKKSKNMEFDSLLEPGETTLNDSKVSQILREENQNRQKVTKVSRKKRKSSENLLVSEKEIVQIFENISDFNLSKEALEALKKMTEEFQDSALDKLDDLTEGKPAKLGDLKDMMKHFNIIPEGTRNENTYIFRLFERYLDDEDLYKNFPMPLLDGSCGGGSTIPEDIWEQRAKNSKYEEISDHDLDGINIFTGSRKKRKIK